MTETYRSLCTHSAFLFAFSFFPFGFLSSLETLYLNLVYIGVWRSADTDFVMLCDFLQTVMVERMHIYFSKLHFRLICRFRHCACKLTFD